MKRIILFLIFIIVFIFSFIFVDRMDVKSEKRDIIKKTVNKKIKKENFKYITEDTDNINEVLKEETKEVIKVNYVYEYIEPEKKNGFIEENGNTYYYIDDKYITGKKELDNDIFYFNEEGIMQKDSIIDNCYYGIDGKLYTGFKDIDNYTYYFSKGGYLKGIQDINDNKYLFDEEGHLIKNTFYDKYYLDENGIIVTGERKIGNRTYIFDENGILKNGFQIIDGKEYFYDENNNVLKGLQLIDDIRYYFDFETGALIKKDVKSIIDISSWQGDIDFEEVKNSGLVDGVIVRIGYGTTLNDDPVLDNKFKRNISELNRLNIPYGVYVYGYAQNEYASSIEAEFVNNVLKEVDAKLSLPIFYDAEINEFEGVTYTKTMYRKVINNFVSVLNNYGYKDVGLYGNLNMLTNGSLSFSKKYPIWVAQYHNKCEYDKEYVGWQYTSKGVIPGIIGNVDLNIFY